MLAASQPTANAVFLLPRKIVQRCAVDHAPASTSSFTPRICISNETTFNFTLLPSSFLFIPYYVPREKTRSRRDRVFSLLLERSDKFEKVLFLSFTASLICILGEARLFIVYFVSRETRRMRWWSVFFVIKKIGIIPKDFIINLDFFPHASYLHF